VHLSTLHKIEVLHAKQINTIQRMALSTKTICALKQNIQFNQSQHNLWSFCPTFKTKPKEVNRKMKQSMM